MSTTIENARRFTVRAGGLLAGMMALTFPLAACGNDEPATEPTPNNISISPSSPAPTPESPAPSGPASPSATDPSTAQTERVADALGAVSVAEATVADSTTVEISKDDDDGRVEWEVTVRAGDNGRELHIAADGSVLENESEGLSEAQRGELPRVTVRDAIQTALKRIEDGEVTDAELSTEDGKRVWDIEVDVPRGDDWDLWIDAATGEVLREERD